MGRINNAGWLGRWMGGWNRMEKKDDQRTN